jgi:hypothetical protein
MSYPALSLAALPLRPERIPVAGLVVEVQVRQTYAALCGMRHESEYSRDEPVCRRRSLQQNR